MNSEGSNSGGFKVKQLKEQQLKQYFVCLLQTCSAKPAYAGVQCGHCNAGITFPGGAMSHSIQVCTVKIYSYVSKISLKNNEKCGIPSGVDKFFMTLAKLASS
jgi:hypothetical protein